jgi:hypothetical protein
MKEDALKYYNGSFLYLGSKSALDLGTFDRSNTYA